MPFERIEFGETPDGSVISASVLTNSRGMQATVLDHGATLTSLKLPGASGDPVDVVLGYDSLDGFLENRQFFGATVGRYANRLAKGRLSTACRLRRPTPASFARQPIRRYARFDSAP